MDANYSLMDSQLEKPLKQETCFTWSSPPAFTMGCNALPVQMVQQNHRADIQPQGNGKRTRALT